MLPNEREPANIVQAQPQEDRTTPECEAATKSTVMTQQEWSKVRTVSRPHNPKKQIAREKSETCTKGARSLEEQAEPLRRTQTCTEDVRSTRNQTGPL